MVELDGEGEGVDVTAARERSKKWQTHAKRMCGANATPQFGIEDDFWIWSVPVKYHPDFAVGQQR